MEGRPTATFHRIALSNAKRLDSLRYTTVSSEMGLKYLELTRGRAHSTSSSPRLHAAIHLRASSFAEANDLDPSFCAR